MASGLKVNQARGMSYTLQRTAIEISLHEKTEQHKHTVFFRFVSN